MKNTKKKGFTIVELVIVIAVIGILSAVLIPTFAGLVGKANESARQQNLTNAYTSYVASVDAASEELYSKEEVYFVAAGSVTVGGDGAITIKNDANVYKCVNGTYTEATTNTYKLVRTDNNSTDKGLSKSTFNGFVALLVKTTTTGA